MNILEAADDPNLFKAWFRDVDSWKAWRAFLAALFGLPLVDGAPIYRACTGRSGDPSAPFNAAWLVCGRRAGKSFILALVAVFLACFRSWSQYLAPGERGHIVIVAADRKQARSIFRYIRALLVETPMLAELVEGETAETIDLTNRVSIEVATASFRTIRGRTVVAALFDEIAFWRDDSSANPDVEILAAIRPAMATVPGAMLLCASSPYARRGVMWEAWQRYFGKDDAPELIWQADTRTMNPTVPQSVIDEAYERDPASAAAEFGGQFRTDVERFMTLEAVRACIKAGERERQPQHRLRYVAFVDPSGGSSDSMTLAVAHKEGVTAILDLVREAKAPFSPEQVVEEFSDTLRNYRISKVYGDRYAGEWPREAFRRHGINYECSEKSKSELYVDLLPLVNAQAVDLLDNDRLATQLVSLERRTARGGRDSVDHAPGGRDDLSNAVAGAVVRAFALSQAATDRQWGNGRQPQVHMGHSAARWNSNQQSSRSYPTSQRDPSRVD